MKKIEIKIKKLITLTDINECASNPCKNGATCTNQQNAFSCTCAAGWTGTTCATGKICDVIKTDLIT